MQYICIIYYEITYQHAFNYKCCHINYTQIYLVAMFEEFCMYIMIKQLFNTINTFQPTWFNILNIC